MDTLDILYESVDELVPYDMISEYNSPFLATEGIISKIQSKWDDMRLKLKEMGEECEGIAKYMTAADTACLLLKKHDDGELVVNKSTADKIKKILIHLSFFVAAAASIAVPAAGIGAAVAVVISGVGTVPMLLGIAAAAIFVDIITSICMVLCVNKYHEALYKNDRKYLSETIANLEKVTKTSKNEKLRKKAAKCIKELKKADKEIQDVKESNNK